MTEQERDVGGNFILESLGPKNRSGLIEDLEKRIKKELALGTLHMDILIGEEILFGTISKVEQRKRPNYAKKEAKDE